MKFIIISLSTAAILLSSNALFASDTKFFAGTSCVGDTLESSSGISYSWGVRAENMASKKKVAALTSSF